MILKMVKFSMILVSVIILAGCASMMGEKASPEMRNFKKIVEIPGQSKNAIYQKANSWFVETFRSGESVIEYQDKEAGKIMGKYVFSYAEGVYTYDVKQVIDVAIKNNKVKVEIKKPLIRTASGLGQSYPNNQYRPLETKAGLNKARDEWNQLVSSLKGRLNKNEEW